MRMAKGYVLMSVIVALVLLAGGLWYLYVLGEREKQHMLQQSAQGFLEKYKDGRFPPPPTAAEVWAAQEQRATRSDAMQPPISLQERTRLAQLSEPSRRPVQAGVFDTHGIPLLSSALFVTVLTALGFAGSTYRLAKQGGRLRDERDRLAQQLSYVRSADPSPQGRPAPPWQQGALMMVRASTVPAIAYDLDARVLEVSEAFTRITGYTRVDIPDVRSWLTKVLRTPEPELEAALESFRTKVHGGELESRTIWTAGGEQRIWLCQPLEVWPLEGDALLLVARATDVTEQAQAAAKARAEADSLRSAARAANGSAASAPAPDFASDKEAEVSAELASRARECEQLAARVQSLTEQIDTQRAEAAARIGELEQRAARIPALQEEAERFKLFAEQFEDSLWLADPRVPRLLYATPQAAKLRSRPLARMMDDFSEWTAAVHAEDRERVREAFTAAAVDGNYDVEYRVVRDDGSIVWLHDRAVAVYDAHKRLRYFAGITADATVRKNADDMMRNTLAMLRAVVEHAPAIVWIKDEQGRYVYANREYARLTGYTSEQLRGRNDYELFPRAIAERLHENDARTLASHTAQQFEEALQFAGVSHHCAALKFPVRNADAAGGALCAIAIDVTERRRNEDLLRAEESRYRAMAASLPEALLVARESKLTYANAAAAKMLGAADGESLIGTPLAQLSGGAETALVNAAKDLATHDGERHKFPLRLKTRDSRELEVEVSAAAYDTATERAVQFVVQDVGEKNARLRALKDAEAFFHSLCDLAPAALRLIEADGRVSFTSRRWEALAGAGSAGDCVAHVHPDDVAHVRGRFGAPSRREETAFVEYRLRPAGDRERWLLETLLPRYDAQGQWKGYLSCCIDISERKFAEDALRAHRDDLADLLDRCPAALWVADAGGVGYANRACIAWLGAKPEDNHGVDLASHIHPEDRDDWMRSRERHTNDGTHFNQVLRMRRFDGEYRHVHVAAAPDGNGKHLVGSLDDVTEYRRTVQALAVEEQRRDQIVGLLGSRPGEGLGPLRRTVELVQVMFPNEPKLQQVSTTVLSEAERLEGLMEELLEPLRAQREARA